MTRDFTLSKYRELCEGLIRSRYNTIIVQEYIQGQAVEQFVILLNDVDRRPEIIFMSIQNKIKRRENEKKFGKWEKLPDGGCKYIYDDNGILVEIHEKYPEDKGHRKIKE